MILKSREEERLEFFRKLRFFRELSEFAHKRNDFLKYNTVKYYLAWNTVLEKVEAVAFVNTELVGVAFSDKEIAEEAIKKFGEDNIKKYFLGKEKYES